ncbi:MAG: hypothetical protein ACRDDY_02090 [Clostridium sp.]|uniref:hypothetical protein n=1 Tax=Clostridium sp. TaxID=1506 RepID=UPI003EE5E0E2
MELLFDKNLKNTLTTNTVESLIYMIKFNLEELELILELLNTEKYRNNKNLEKKFYVILFKTKKYIDSLNNYI